MNTFDPFLRRHDIDVGRSFAVCGLMTTFIQLCGVVGDFFNGNISINLGVPIGVIVAIGLWKHKSWARFVTLVGSWLAVLFLSVLTVLIVLGVPGNYTLTFGSTVIKHPTSLQAVVFFFLLAPVAFVLLGALHSGKARDEFLGPNQQPTDPTPATGTPVAGQPTRQL
jgi:hypothetical protein